MRSLEEIYNEIEKGCLENNCQSAKSIAITAMRKAIDEYRSSIVDEIEYFEFRDSPLEYLNDN